MDDVCSLIPRDQKTIIDWKGFCRLPSNFEKGRMKGPFYWDWENAVKHYLEAQGWTEIRFVDGVRDSFGPLTRIMYGYDPNGNERSLFYG